MKRDFIKVRFGEKEFYVVATVEYENVKYFYLVESVPGAENLDIDNLQDDVNIEINFVFKRDDGLYENVTDDELFDKLLKLVSIDYIAGNNQFIDVDDE